MVAVDAFRVLVTVDAVEVTAVPALTGEPCLSIVPVTAPTLSGKANTNAEASKAWKKDRSRWGRSLSAFV
jgi:hypothetical protein